MSEKKEEIFNGIWDTLEQSEKNVVVVNHLKSLPKWDLKRVICAILDCDMMDDENLRKSFEEIIWTR